MRKLLAVTALLAAASSCSSNGTYVIVTVDAAASAPAGIVAVELNLSLDGMTAQDTLREPSGGAIQFPTSAVLSIGKAAGTLTITAKALDAGGATLATASGTGTVARGSTITIPITFGSIVATDGGADLTPVNAAVLTPDATTFDFGSAVTGSSSQPKSFTITNTGTVASAALASALNPTGQFTIANDLCAGMTLAVNASCTVSVTFSPTASAAGTSPTTTLTVSAQGATPATVALSGAAVAPGALMPSVPSLTLGSVVQGGKSGEMTVMITNTGGAVSGSMAVALGGTNMNEFVVTTDTCSTMTLNPNANCTLGIRFEPLATTSAGTKSASLTISATPGGTALVSLGGTSLTPGMVSISPSSKDFLTQAITTTSTAQTFTVTNNGGGMTGALGVALSGTDMASFAIVVGSDNCTGTQLAGGGGSCTVQVTFKPGTYGAKTASLDITGTPFTSQSAPLMGTGQDTIALSVTNNAGTGSGTVKSADGMINCTAGNTGTCSTTYTRTTAAPTVTLTETPDVSSTFNVWGGACSGNAATCTPDLSGTAPVAVTANFTIRTFTLTLTNAFHPVGTGAIGSTAATGGATLTCATAGPCTVTYNYSTVNTITVKATANAGDKFVRWGGDCAATGTAITCTLNMTASHPVSATYRASVNYMFISSTTLAMPFAATPAAAVTAADNFCTARGAALSPVPWVAVISTGAMAANSRMPASTGYMRPDGQPIGNSGTMFGSGGAVNNGVVLYPPRLDENGADVGANTQAATASDPTGAFEPNNCASFTDATAANNVRSGNAGAGTAAWINGFYHSCALPSHLYCIEKNFTGTLVTPAPVPNGSRIAFVSPALTSGGGIAALDNKCQAQATASGLTGTFKALVASTTVTAASRFAAGPAWYRVDGVPVFLTFSDLQNGVLQATISADSNPAAASRIYYSYATRAVYTGAANPNTVGTAASTCTNYTAVTTTFSTGADPGDTVEWFTGVGTECSDTTDGVYCLQQ